MRGEADLMTHQLEAVRLVEERLRLHGGAVLADPAGSGKSWVAAAIARRWESQGSVVSIVVPAALEHQWRVLLESWGCVASVTTHDSISPGESADLIIVDEAHRFRNVETRRFRRLAVHCSASSVLLITATPTVNGPEDLVNILRLFLEDDGLADFGLASIDEALDRDAIEEIGGASRNFVVRRRSGTDLQIIVPWKNESTIRYRMPDAWYAIFDQLNSLEFPGAANGAAGLRSLLRRRLLSSPAALRGTVERQLRYLRRLAEAERSGGVLMRKMHRRALEDVESEQSMLFPDAFFEDACAGSPASKAEMKRLEDLLVLLRDGLEDPKLQALEGVLGGALPSLVFTESAETARYLWSSLSDHFRCGLITAAGARDGTGQTLKVSELFDVFQCGSLDLLVTTDLAAEGVDLQRARSVIHYDLPWSRVRLDQRVGRAARIGSAHATVDSILIVPEGDTGVALDAISRKEQRCARLDIDAQAKHPSRFFIPRIGRPTPQHVLARSLVSSGAMDSEIAEVLSRRYRAGVEVQLREIQERGRLPIAVLTRAVRRAVALQRARRRSVPDGERSVSHTAMEESARLW